MKKQAMEQQELQNIIEKCKKGSNDAYSRLVDLYSKKLYAYFYRMTGNNEISNDLLSEMFLKIVKNIKKFKDGSFESWIYRIASNTFNDFLRQKQKSQKINDAYKKHLRQSQQNQQTDKLEKIDAIQPVLNRIEPDEREIIMLRYYSQLSFKQIAALRNEPIGTTLSKLHRSLKKLRQIMENNNE